MPNIFVRAAYKVSKADHIVVLDGGMVCEEGSHNELLALEGKYAELVRLQR